MKIRNLVEEYRSVLSGEISIDAYTATFPALFGHYTTFWGSPSAAFCDDTSAIERGEKLILEKLPQIESAFAENGLEIANISLVLFVGQNVTNGHAAFLDNEWWVWIPVEAYASAAQVDAFLPHEILHAVQYSKHPDLYFSTEEERRRLSRQTITEGVATYGAAELMGLGQKEALWADLLNAEEYAAWLDQYDTHRQELLNFVYENWDGDADELFQANDSADIFRFRAGYLLGLEAIQTTFGDVKLLDLINIETRRFSAELFRYIESERNRGSAH